MITNLTAHRISADERRALLNMLVANRAKLCAAAGHAGLQVCYGTDALALAQRSGLTLDQARDVVNEATFWLCPELD